MSSSLGRLRLAAPAALVSLAAAGLLAGCTGGSGPASPQVETDVGVADGKGGGGGHAGRSAPGPGIRHGEADGRDGDDGDDGDDDGRKGEIPFLGPATRAEIPSGTAQAVLVAGDSPDANRVGVVLYERDPESGWKPVSGVWPAHNGLKGWTRDHREGDLRSPVGVFRLTDAGGRLPDPGTRLPYDRDDRFTVSGTGFEGEPLAGSFDHVVAINYNRKPGATPLDWTRPLGEERGGGIWIHVDHGGPTQGCVSLQRERMRELLRWLDPDKQPVVVMGDKASLGR
ncbi:L,D-transpeptidase family protein [Streptomyces sp. MUM 178J]|uniref:L,D-transpeptidase family protein n=1 Tax=Streptomyces sp. MUM 178J TaxID=2791991 RepID=UPI001F03B193|nr:L,D-transpeptidase family protein [Streptomyces sp. MUM 178J]WRQ82387.1 L,D-transpeptidase family protein [Streptomyces sp. MUM 178J]